MVLRMGQEPDPSKRIRERQGDLIRKTRTLRALTMAELATIVGVTEGAISQWETGRYAPRQHHQVALARALDVPWSMIFGLDAESAA